MLDQVAPVPTTYPPYDLAGFVTMEHSGAGDVTAPIVKAANLGCGAADFAGADFSGKVALIERGVCYFSDKAIGVKHPPKTLAALFMR